MPVIGIGWLVRQLHDLTCNSGRHKGGQGPSGLPDPAADIDTAEKMSSPPLAQLPGQNVQHAPLCYYLSISRQSPATRCWHPASPILGAPPAGVVFCKVDQYGTALKERGTKACQKQDNPTGSEAEAGHATTHELGHAYHQCPQLLCCEAATHREAMLCAASQPQ